MVYIEQQSEYLKQFKNSPLSTLLNEILRNELGSPSEGTNNASDMAINLLIAVKSQDRELALKYYKIFSKRQPTKDSHWIYDNYVVFSIVCAVRCFGLDTLWTREVIDISYTGTNQINKKIKDTFKNILAGNYNANGDFHQLSMVYQYLSKDECYDNEAINRMFRHLWLKSFPFFEEDFLNVLSIKAIEIAFLKKALLSEREFYYLNNFIPNFNTRADIIAKVISRFIIISLIASVFYLLWKLNSSEVQYPLLVKTAVFFSSFSGVGVLAVWGWKSKLGFFIRNIINRLFSYKSQLADKL